LGMDSPKSFTYYSKRTLAVVILFFFLLRCLLPCTDPEWAVFRIYVIKAANLLLEYPIAKAKHALHTLFPYILVMHFRMFLHCHRIFPSHEALQSVNHPCRPLLVI
jgi:hypothetical protein